MSNCVILGNPTETKQEIRNTINLCLELWKIHPRMSFSLGTYMPYPGVPLYDMVVEAGFVPPKHTEDWETLNRMNKEMEVSWLPWVTANETKKFVRAGGYARILPLGNLKIPILNRIPHWRLAHYNFTFPIELGPLNWVHRKFADRRSRVSDVMRKIAPYLGNRRRTLNN